MLFLIRHAQAGASNHSDPNDGIRPLDSYGRDQAEWIATRLASERVDSFFSSPALRCLQTIQPAADRVGKEVLVAPGLAEGSSVAAAIDAVRAAGEHAAVCLHGDLLPEIITTFANGGMEILTEPCFSKGVIWTVEFDADGRPLRAVNELAPGRPADAKPALEGQ